MSQQRLTERTELTSPNVADIQHLVDVSDTTDSASGTSKRITLQNIFDYLKALAQTLTNKTISLTSNTLTGTTAEFNTALSDGNFATQAGTETLTNKTLSGVKIGAADGIYDSNGNEQILFGQAANATNFLNITNAASGSDAAILATGSDTDVSLDLQTKGAGVVKVNGAQLGTSYSEMFGQAMINGAFDIWQRATTFTTPNDDTFGPDRWNFLTDGNGAWTFAQDTDVPTGDFKYSMKATNVTLNKQCGIVQILENIDAEKFQDKTVSLSFYAKTSGTEIANLRATVLSWTSTADTVTSDVIGTWAGNGTDPTFATNWTKEVAGSNKALTSSWQRFTMTGIAIDTASITNLAVVIWVDDTTIAANDDFWITGVKLELGSVVTAYQPKHLSHELRDCQRYVYKLSNFSKSSGRVGFGFAVTTTAVDVFIEPPVTMRTVPTLTYTAISGNVWTLSDGITATNVTALEIRSWSARDCLDIAATVASGLTQFRPYFLEAGTAADTYLMFSAEL